ncbi:MAG: UDP-3-O-(3-hydroxymyristoyl)glucosamine N-acyltransferase [Verrucomicrobiota bacterium]|nr:UDP-3-O-(3-hydroxymyristoyl)glucosamine N-acyltransferase [Verrucomicrobiota bacterium]
MTLTLQELAEMSGGELIGDPSQVITGAASLSEAIASDISFFAHVRYSAQLHKTQASAVFVPSDFSEATDAAQLRVADPAKAFEQVVIKFAPPPLEFAAGIHPTAVIAADAHTEAGVTIQPFVVIESGAQIGAGTVIGAHCYIGHDTKIGADCLIYPRVTIRERIVIGSRVIIHSGAVIGADGFGFEMVDGVQRKIPQIGTVQIDDDVEIGANTTIDRARFGRTWIKRGTKLDNLVHLAHNVVLGEHTIIAGQSGFAGSARAGDYVMIGGQVGVNDHVEIGDRNIIGGQTFVTGNLPPNGGTWWGTPATPLPQAKKQLVWLHRLGSLFERVKAIEKKLGL